MKYLFLTLGIILLLCGLVLLVLPTVIESDIIKRSSLHITIWMFISFALGIWSLAMYKAESRDD